MGDVVEGDRLIVGVLEGGLLGTVVVTDGKLFDGAKEGRLVGTAVGRMVGRINDGALEGGLLGTVVNVGVLDGALVGAVEGETDGKVANGEISPDLVRLTHGLINAQSI